MGMHSRANAACPYLKRLTLGLPGHRDVHTIGKRGPIHRASRGEGGRIAAIMRWRFAFNIGLNYRCMASAIKS